MEDLLERIQASEEELKTHLETIHACQIDGKQWHYLNNKGMYNNYMYIG